MKTMKEEARCELDIGRAIAVVFALACLGNTRVAIADEGGGYILGSFGTMSSGSDESDMNAVLIPAGASASTYTTKSATVATFLGGYKLNRYAAIEGGYIRSVRGEKYAASAGGASTNVDVSVSGSKLVVVGIAPLSQDFNVLGKIGIAALYANPSVNGSSSAVSALASTSDSKSSITYGAAASYAFSKQVMLRADVDRYSTRGLSSGTNNRTTLTVGLGYRFGDL